MPCAEIYPLNLMQLVLPKGKVGATSVVLFPFLIQAIPIVDLKLKRMEITVNNQPYSVDQPCSVTVMLSAVLQISADGLAVAVNQSVVSKHEWQEFLLQPGDQVILIKATQGG